MRRKKEPDRKNVTTTEKFFDAENLERDFIKKQGKKPLKSLKEIQKESAETPVPVSDFRPSFSSADDMFVNDASVEEGLGRLLTTITDPKNTSHFTELNDSEIKYISTLESANLEINSLVLKTFLTKFKDHRVSNVRKGRAELVEIAKAMLTPQQSPTGALDKLVKGVTNK